MTLIRITNDLYDIVWRLKAINSNYAVYYNVDERRYEVHDEAKQTLEFVVPYNELDARTVQYANYSRVANAKAIFAEIDRHNEAIERQRHRQIVDETVSMLKEVK